MSDSHDPQFEAGHQDAPSPTEHRMAIRFRIDGDLRFVSHHDTVRLFERALARAAIPVKFSKGFNPRPQLSLPLPRPVGVASDDETLIIACGEAINADEIMERLGPQMPEGLALVDVTWLNAGDRHVPCQAEYEIELDPATEAQIAPKVGAWQSQDKLDVTRRDHKSGTTRRIDIRPYLAEIRLSGSRLAWTQRFLASGTARPAEVMEALGLNPEDWVHRIRRRSVCYLSR